MTASSETGGSDRTDEAVADEPSNADPAEETVVDVSAKKKYDGSEETRPEPTPAIDEDDAEKTTYDPVVNLPAAPSETNESAPSGNSSSTAGRASTMDYGPSHGGPAPDHRSSPYARTETATLEPAMSPPTSRARRPAELAKPAAKKTPRKAHLQVARFEPWSVMKFSFIMSLVCFLVLFVAVTVLYLILSGLGVFDAISGTIRDLTANDQGKSSGINPASWFSAGRILGYTALIGTLNVLLITALATVWSVIYNMASDLVGGVEVTLKEADQ